MRKKHRVTNITQRPVFGLGMDQDVEIRGAEKRIAIHRSVLLPGQSVEMMLTPQEAASMRLSGDLKIEEVA